MFQQRSYWRGYATLTFEQKMLLSQFRVRVILSYTIIYSALIALIFDIGTTSKLAPWLTSTIGFVIGWWMPSPGSVPPNQNFSQTQIDTPIITIPPPNDAP